MVHEPYVTGGDKFSPSPLRIVVLEDNPAEARLLQERLSDVDAEISCDFAGELWEVSPERLDAADCAVIDLGLPDSSGLEALGWIKDLAPEIAIVVLTGLDDEATALAALRGGAQEYLVKDHVDGFVLVRAIRYAIVRREIETARDRRLLGEEEQQLEFIQQLLSLGLAMETTQAWLRQPSMVARMSEHVSAITRLTETVKKSSQRRAPELRTSTVHESD